MENTNMLDNLRKKRNEEYKKMKDLDEVWFNEKIDFDTSIEIRQEYEKHKDKYFFYKNIIDKMGKEEKE